MSKNEEFGNCTTEPDDIEFANVFTYSATIFFTRFPIIACHDLSRITEWIYGLERFLRRGYNFAAALITLVTVVQTCYAILSYHYPHEDGNNNQFNSTQIHAKIN